MKPELKILIYLGFAGGLVAFQLGIQLQIGRRDNQVYTAMAFFEAVRHYLNESEAVDSAISATIRNEGLSGWEWGWLEVHGFQKIDLVTFERTWDDLLPAKVQAGSERDLIHRKLNQQLAHLSLGMARAQRAWVLGRRQVSDLLFAAIFGHLVLGGAVLALSIRRPVDQLTGVVNRMASGELGIHEDSLDRYSGLDQLGKALSRLARSMRAAQNSHSEGTVRLALANKELAHRSKALEAVELDLQHSEQKYRQLFETSADAIMTLDDKGFLDCNQATVKIFGFQSKQAFLCLHPSEVSPAYQADGQPSFEAANAKINAAFVNGSNQFEWLHQRKNGEVFPADVLLTCFFDGEKRLLQATVRDISDRKRYEALLREMNMELKEKVNQRTSDLEAESRIRKRAEQKVRLAAKVFETAVEGILVLDNDWRLLEANTAFSSLTGMASDHLIGRRISFLISFHHGRGFYKEILRAVYQEGFWQGEMYIPRENGTTFPCWLSVSRAGDDGQAGYIVIFNDITELKIAKERLEKMAHFDPLTGLPNRNLMEDRLGRAMKRALRNDTQLALMVFDLDRFKNINDSMGHKAGDRLLAEVAGRLKTKIRSNDTVARIGGDEFTVIVSDIHDPRKVARVAESILEALAEPFRWDGYEFYISASIGVAFYPTDAQEEEQLFKFADMAMYHAKDSGRNNFKFFSQELQTSAMRYLRTEVNLRRALEQDELILHFQPQFNVKNGNVLGFEALVRWNDPERGIILPGHFIDCAEESGLIVPLGDWVLHQACRQAHIWRQGGAPPFRMCVNISGKQFKHRHIGEQVAKILKATGWLPQFLEIEITETALLEDVDSALRVLQELKEMGVSLAIDDFGMGYSSLSYLRKFPIDRLKIDRHFVRNIGKSEDDTKITAAIIALAKNLNLQVVAEGVEQQSQLDFLLEHGCDMVQGFLLARPNEASVAVRHLYRSA